VKARNRKLHLTRDHIDSVHRSVEDAGVPPGLQLQTDADYQDWVSRIIARHPAPDRPTQLFVYGSLIWKPEIEHVDEKDAVAMGWHRSFCFRAPRFRGTPDQPGLMMALDRGGQCRGVLLQLPDGNLSATLDKLFRREFTYKPVNSMPRWIKVLTREGPSAALTFVMNRSSPLYVGRLPEDVIAKTLATACGHWGSGAEYLLNTVTNLEAKGIHDRYLWSLQKAVALQIEAMRGNDMPSP
jgi:glutathione-specific gamma-glutamylcyclotransferase